MAGTTPTVKERVCSKCKKLKPVNHFYRSGTGYQSWCKRCTLDSARISRARRCASQEVLEAAREVLAAASVRTDGWVWIDPARIERLRAALGDE